MADYAAVSGKLEIVEKQILIEIGTLELLKKKIDRNGNYLL